MTSSELRSELNSFNSNIDGVIGEYNDALSSVTTVDNKINSIKGEDTNIYSSLIENNFNVSSGISKNIATLTSLKATVNAETEKEIERLYALEQAAKEQEEENEE